MVISLYTDIERNFKKQIYRFVYMYSKYFHAKFAVSRTNTNIVGRHDVHDIMNVPTFDYHTLLLLLIKLLIKVSSQYSQNSNF